jgi:multiple sugar transport system ATP-binding protein
MGTVTYDHVTKQFDEVVALNDLVLDIEDGEFLVLVGPSGCGKSTALRCLAGLEEVSSGDIRIADRSVTNVSPKDRDIAMVFQNYALYPHMNVRNNLSFGLKLRKTPRDEINRRIQEASEMLGIGDLLDRQPRQLSGGQRQRVALGRAIVREPQVFLMDEPLSNLDAKLRVQTRAELTQLQSRLRTTTIYVTHDQVEAMTMGDRIAVMNLGVLQQLDTPQNLYDHPANLFVATFIGSPAMNVFEAEAIANDGSVSVVAEGVNLAIPASRAERLKNHIGKKVHVGIRPESFTLSRSENGQHETPGVGQTVKMEVTLVEPLGSEILVHLKGPEDKPIIARLDPHEKVSAWEAPEMRVDLDLVHFFDPETERALG